MTFTPRPRQLFVDRIALHSAIQQAFVESRFAYPPRPWLVDIFHDGSVTVTDPATPPLHGILPLLSVACNGAPEHPSPALPMNGAWSREEFHGWVSSRNDLYLTPTLDVLYLRAHTLGVELMLTDR